MKSVGEITSEIWPVVSFFTHFGENLTLTFCQGHKHLGAFMGCTLVPSMKSVGVIASEIRTVLCFFTYFWEHLTLTFDLDIDILSLF